MKKLIPIRTSIFPISCEIWAQYDKFYFKFVENNRDENPSLSLIIQGYVKSKVREKYNNLDKLAYCVPTFKTTQMMYNDSVRAEVAQIENLEQLPYIVNSIIEEMEKFANEEIEKLSSLCEKMEKMEADFSKLPDEL